MVIGATLPAAEARVLLWAVASPIRLRSVLRLIASPWVRTDTPAGAGAQALTEREGEAVGRLGARGLLRLSDGCRAVEATDEGLAVAGDLREALGDDRRLLLRGIAEAGELVRRERPNYTDVHVRGDWLVEWLRPSRAAVDHLAPRGERRACYDWPLQQLVRRGLVVLLAGGSRAVVSGAGRWCAAPAPSSDSKAVATRAVPG